MLAGLYSTAAGLNAAEMAHEVVARNLAHADVPGFRRQEASIATFESALLEANANAGAASGDLSRLVQASTWSLPILAKAVSKPPDAVWI